MTPDTSVLNARRLLQSHRIRHLPVVDSDHRLVGMLSDRDVLLRDGEIAQALTALQSDLAWGRYRPVGTVMTPAPLQVARPDEPIGLAAQLMRQWQISALPVVDQGRLVGIITTSDCLRALQEGDAPAASGWRPSP